MSRNLAWITAQIFDVPLMLHPAKLAQVLEVLQGRLVLPAEANLQPLIANMSQFEGGIIAAPKGEWNRVEPFRMARNGIAVISAVGTLVDRGGWVGADSGLVSHEGLKWQIKRAALNRDVNAIVLDVSSPGGEAAGAPAMAAMVRAAAERKPVYAIANSMATSAAYSMISGATRIIASPGSHVGHIGVLMVHVDRSGEFEQKGWKPTLIYAGDHKVDGNPTAPLPDSVREDLQAAVNAIYGKFLDTVATGRGRKLSRKAAKETQARVFDDEEAVKLGLADAVGTFEELLHEAGRKIARAKGKR